MKNATAIQVANVKETRANLLKALRASETDMKLLMVDMAIDFCHRVTGGDNAAARERWHEPWFFPWFIFHWLYDDAYCLGRAQTLAQYTEMKRIMIGSKKLADMYANHRDLKIRLGYE